jgi:hypothetical protein
MHKVDVGCGVQSLEQGVSSVVRLTSYIQGIPSHAGHLVLVLLGAETTYIGIKDTNAVYVAFF